MSELKLGSVSTVLCVGVIKPMLDYFVERLGFHVQGSAGQPPTWASLMRDRVEFMLVCGPSFPSPPQDWAAYVFLSKADIDLLHAEFAGRGADLLGPPVDKSYGSREFEVRLPDGRLIAFGG